MIFRKNKPLNGGILNVYILHDFNWLIVFVNMILSVSDFEYWHFVGLGYGVLITRKL